MLGAVLVATAVLFSLVGPSSGSAEAATRCKGHRVKTLSFSTGTVKVYRSGGDLCAVTVAKHTGSRKTMTVSIQKRGQRPVQLKGKAKKYMGGVTIPVRRNHPVWIKGSVGGGKVGDGWFHL
ncbi:hypothetical protein P8605_39650 [Streptomyces sp. T-3]|nr:hypothetical protein [Streptomyces sp. T-3]